MNNRSLTKDSIIEQIIYDKITPFLGIDVELLKQKFLISSNAKNINSMIITKMMDLTTFSTDDLVYIKNYYVFKTVVLSEKDRVAESMSFPAIDYFDMLKNNWHSSSVYNYFSNKTICLFVFKRNLEKLIFQKVILLNLLDEEINQIFLIWEKVKNMLANDLLVIGGKNGFSVENFPKKDENDIVHIRPHDTNSSEGKVLLPNGKRIMNYCFWLNNNFIEKKVTAGEKL